MEKATAIRLQLVGAALALAALAVVAFAYLIQPAWAFGLLAAMAAELVTGREAAIPLAMAAGTPPAWIAATSILQNLALAALLVPLAARSVSAVRQRTGFSARFMQGLQESAQRQLPRGRSAWALFVFMLIPFVANGPILAGVVGVMAAMPTKRLVAVVVGAVVVTATAWSYAYVALNGALASVHPTLALVPAVLAAFAVLVWLASAARRAFASSPS